MTQTVEKNSQIQQEFSALHAELQESLDTLKQLKGIERHFTELLGIYESIKAFHGQATTDLAESQGTAERLFGELAARDEEQKASLVNLRVDLETMQRDFEGGTEKRLIDFQSHLEQQLSKIEANAQTLSTSLHQKMAGAESGLDSFHSLIETLDAKHQGLDVQVTVIENRLGKITNVAMGLGVFNLLLIIGLGVMYLLL